MEATHQDGTLHRWVKYYSLDSLGRRKRGKPKIIICPKCGQKGKVNSFRPDQTRPDLVKYVIRLKNQVEHGAEIKSLNIEGVIFQRKKTKRQY